jgi:hypothetical protein
MFIIDVIAGFGLVVFFGGCLTAMIFETMKIIKELRG